MNLIKEKLLGYASIKISGVRITIRKLTPDMFVDSEKLFPMSAIIPADESTEEKSKSIRDIARFKEDVKAIIQKAVIAPRLDYFIDEFMETDNYLTLFSAIHLHTFGSLKKKTLRQFDLTRVLQIQYSF